MVVERGSIDFATKAMSNTVFDIPERAPETRDPFLPLYIEAMGASFLKERNGIKIIYTG